MYKEDSMSKSKSFIWQVTKLTGSKKVAKFRITARGPDGSHVDPTNRLERKLGRNNALNLAAQLLSASDAPKELIQSVESLKNPDEEELNEEELITADALPEEVAVVERLVGRWLEAVDQAREQKLISASTASTYRQHPGNLLAWVKGDFQPGRAGRRRQMRSTNE
jgi:hypothetical protein